MKFVIIDDNADLCEILSQALSLRGHTAFVATRGDIGLATIIEVFPDAVICDIGLPGMDGRTIAKTIRAANRRFAQMPLVAISGFGRDIDRQKAIDAGFNYLLAKPIELNDLMVILEQIEKAHRSLKSRAQSQ